MEIEDADVGTVDYSARMEKLYQSAFETLDEAAPESLKRVYVARLLLRAMPALINYPEGRLLFRKQAERNVESIFSSIAYGVVGHDSIWGKPIAVKAKISSALSRASQDAGLSGATTPIREQAKLPGIHLVSIAMSLLDIIHYGQDNLGEEASHAVATAIEKFIKVLPALPDASAWIDQAEQDMRSIRRHAQLIFFPLWSSGPPQAWDVRRKLFGAAVGKSLPEVSILLDRLDSGTAQVESLNDWLIGWLDRQLDKASGGHHSSTDSLMPESPRPVVPQGIGSALAEDFSEQNTAVGGDTSLPESEVNVVPNPEFSPGSRVEATQPAAALPQTALASLVGAQVEALATRDCLGREQLTDALRRLITERADKHHFALGLFGYWGTGKSSLIQQLRSRLEKDHQDIIVAEFNAWKNEKATHIGAMLAQTVVDGLTADLSYWGKLKLAVRLAAKRQSRLYKDIGKDGSRTLAWLETWGWVALPPLLALLATGLLLWVLPVANSPLAPILAGVAGLGLALAATYRSVAGFLKENLTEWFKLVGVEKPGSLLQLPSYGEHRGLLGEIHRTLDQLCKAQLGDDKAIGGKSLLLIVDDVDRCSVNAVKEVLDAVRLVADIPRVMTIVAIDERMAFAAVEKHYDQFGHVGRAPALVAREYLSKVLQASVSLPEVGNKEIDEFVTQSLFKDVEAPAKKEHRGAEINKPDLPLEASDPARPGLKTPASKAAPDMASGQGASESVTPPGLSPSPEEPLEPSPSTETNDLIPSPKPLPEEVELFSKLAKAYRFGNPRLLGRLNLAWRLLKAWHYGGKRYSFEEVENGLRLLFWREYRLQQEAKLRDMLDAWQQGGALPTNKAELASLKALNGLPAHFKNDPKSYLQNEIQPELPRPLTATSDDRWLKDNASFVVDSVLLPASAKLPEKEKPKAKQADQAAD